MRIGAREIGPGYPVFVVAELSCNHIGSLEVARRSIETAARCGADAVKLQLDDPNGGITIDSNAGPFRIETGPWAGRTLHDLYSETYTPWEWVPLLQPVAAACGVELFATVSCPNGVRYGERYGLPAYKVASFEISDHILLSSIAATGKPVILSDGCDDGSDMQEALGILDGSDVAILHCVSQYPAESAQYDLDAVEAGGISDHTVGNTLAIAAVARGACILEKHFTLGRSLGGPDAGFSANPVEFRRYVNAVRETEAIGTVPREVDRRFCKSLFVVHDCEKGESLQGKIGIIRPGAGMHPRNYADACCGTATRDLKRGEPLREGDYEPA